MLVQKLPAIVWFAVAMIGLGLQIADYVDVLGDRRWLRRLNLNGRMAIIADGHVRRSTLTLCAIASIAVIGLAAITVPTATDQPPPRTVAGIVEAVVITLGLYAIEFLLVATTYYGRRDRKAILAIALEQTHHGDEGSQAVVDHV